MPGLKATPTPPCGAELGADSSIQSTRSCTCVDCLATIDFDDERSAGSCTYVDPDTRQRFNVKLIAQDQTITVYERRTGRQVAKKRFKASRPRCDKKTLVFACVGRGDKERWPLYDKIRSAAYDALSRRPKNEMFVMTNALCVGFKAEEEAWKHVVDLARARDVALYPVLLVADPETIAQRITSESRSDMKLKNADALREMIGKYELQKPAGTFTVDVGGMSVQQSVDVLVQYAKQLPF